MKSKLVAVVSALIIGLTATAPSSAQEALPEIKPKDQYPAEVVQVVEKGFTGPLSDAEA